MSNSVEKSRISEKMFKSLFKSIPVPSYVWKIVENDLLLIEYNTSAEKITNGQIKNDLGRKASDIYKDQSEFYEGLSRCASSKCRVSKEIKTVCMTTGEEIYISVEYSHVPPDLVLVHTEDITKKKKFEQILKREAEKAGKYLNLAGVIIVALNENGEITLLNKKGYEILEYEEDELIGRNWFRTCVPTRLRTQVLDVFNKLMRGEIKLIDFYENPIISKNGEEKIITWHNTLLYDDVGQIIGTLSSGEDITHLKKAEEALKISQERLKRLNLVLEKKVEERTKQLWKVSKDYQLLIENAPVGVFLADKEGNIKIVNPLLLKILGSPSAEATKQINLLTFPLLKKAGISAAIEHCMKKKEATVSEFLYRSKWGKDLYCRLYLNPARDPSNQIFGIQGIVEDISEHKKIEQKIRESEEKYRLITENMNDMITVIDSQFKIYYINEEVHRKLTGYTMEDIIGKNVYELIHPNERDRILLEMEKAFKTGQGFVEVRIKNKNGNYIWTENNGKMYIDNDGNQKILIISRDITKRKKTLQKLKESEEQYRTMINYLDDPLYVVDRDLRILLINPAFEHWLDDLGIEKNIVGRTIFEAFPFLSDEVRMEYEQLFDSGESQYIEGSTIINDREIITETLRIPIFKEGHVSQVLVITRDVTERKNTEKKIIESEEKYRLLAENINDIIIVIDDKFQVEYINEEVHKKVLGTTKKDILGKNLLDLVHPDDKTIGLNSLLKGIKDKEGIMEIRVRNRKGHYLWFEAKGKAFLNNKGELKGILIARDITERKQAEEKLRESEERYHTLVETMTHGLSVIDENSCFTYLNISFCKMIGYSYDELLGTSIFNYLDKKNQSIVEDQLIKRKKGEAQSYELVWTRKDGQKVYTITAPKPLIDAEGNYIGSFAVITNITGRIITEQRLKASEEKYRSLVETTSDWIWEMDENAIYTYSSPKIKDILGYDVEEVIGQTPFDFMPSSEAERVNKLFKEAYQRNQPIDTIKNKNLHKNGSFITLETSGVPFFDDDGKLLGYRGIDRDITELMKIEEILQKTKQQLQDMFDNTPAVIFAKDLEGRYILVNNMWRERTKIGDKDPIGKTSAELFPHFPLKKWDSNEKQVLKSGEALQFEEIGKTTGRVYLATKFLMRDTDGKVYASGNVSLDITERKNAVQKLKESEEKYHTLFDGANDAIFLMIKEIFVECNKKTLEMFGCENERDLIGVPPWVFSPTKQPDGRDSSEKALEYINNAFNGKPQRFYWKHSKKDGKTFDAEVSLNRILIDDKYMIQAIVRDITKYLMAVQKLEESEETVKTLNDTFLEFIDDPLKNIQLLVDAAGKLLMSDCALYNKLIDVNGKKKLKTIAIWQEPPNFDREDNPIGHICTDIINMNSDDIVILKDLDKTKYAKTDPNVQKYNLKQYCGIAVRLNNESVVSFCVVYRENRELSEVDKDIIRILAKSASIEEQRLYSYQQIKESEHKFKLIFESIPDLFFLIDKDTTILDFKGREEDLYVPAEKLINHKLREIIPRYIADLNYIATKKTLLTKQPQILEYELPIHDVNRHFEARHLYFSENQVAVFIREITARKKIEQNLRESEEKYRQLFENSPEAIMLTNIDGMVLDFNSAAEKIFGFGKNEVMGRYFYQFGIFNSDQIAIIKNRIMDLSLVRQKKFEEFKIKRKDGSLLWVLFQSSIVKLGNEPYLLSIAQDITEIKKAEKLIEKELIKLKELDEIKNELITRASHEFKTPLTLILGSAELFLKLFKGVYTDEMKQLIEIIYKGGKRLENLVKNTIDISLMDSKSISFRSEREDIGKLINECVNDLIYLADKRELLLELNVQENIFIPIDKNRITQVIKNIVSNAIKNTPPKGNISISLNRTNKHLQISIKDTGVGFTETEIQRLFQKFGKIERYGKDFDVDIEGPGLGLYLAKQIIEMHGGKIWVESEGINKGATFIIELPINL